MCTFLPFTTIFILHNKIYVQEILLQIQIVFICNMFLHGHNAMLKVISNKSFSGFGWTLKTCRIIKKWHITHFMNCTPYMSTFVVLLFNLEMVHDCVMQQKGTHKLVLVVTYASCWFQNTSSSTCHSSLVITSTSYNTSFNKIEFSSLLTTKWSNPIVWNSSP
jgi:hypothetical protein